MKTVREVMSDDLITINPSSTVKTAIILMKGHNISALPVVNEETLLGMVDSEQILGADLSSRVSAVMTHDFESISPDVQIYKAAELMAKHQARRLVVEEEGQLVGILTLSDLIPVLGRSYDPLSGLPWSDTLREWGVEALTAGNEIAILFFDMDRFGAFNKKYGHVTGDTVLKALSEVLQAHVDTNTDILCRMGGDEFVIASVRPYEEALELANQIQEDIAEVDVDGLPESLSISYGVAGGRRAKGRESVHVSATFDDLLNRASIECQVMKRQKREGHQEASDTAAQPAEAGARAFSQTIPPLKRLRIEKLNYSSGDSEITVDVTLSAEQISSTYSVSAHPSSRSVVRLVAEACAGAIQMAVPEGYTVSVEDIVEYRMPSSETVLLSSVALSTGRESMLYYGIAVVRRGDAHRAAAASVLSALNRPVGQLVKWSAV